MSYSSRVRYKTRRERNERSWKNAKLVIVFLLIALSFYCYWNRVAILDYLRTYFM